MRHIISIKATLLDPSNAQQVADFNQAVESLQELLTGKKKKQRTPQDVNSIMKDFKENYLKPMSAKFKNFERAK
jgi:hypothetical protein